MGQKNRVVIRDTKTIHTYWRHLPGTVELAFEGKKIVQWKSEKVVLLFFFIFFYFFFVKHGFWICYRVCYRVEERITPST